jgi:sensor c-di-GMP phosphodiesterase-like protein
MGRYLTYQSAGREVLLYLDNIRALITSVEMQASNALSQANKISERPCSSADIIRLRQLAIRAPFIQDIGRIVGEKTACSSSLSLLSASFDDTPANIVFPANRQIWTEIPLLLSRDTKVLLVQEGRANVVIDPAIFLDLGRVPFRYSVMIVDPISKRPLRVWGAAEDRREPILTEKTTLDTPASMKRRFCSPTFPFCAMVAIDRKDAVDENMPLIYSFIGLGGLCGGLLAMAILCRPKSSRYPN